MTIAELYSLYTYILARLDNEENDDIYLPDENAIMNLYYKIIHGQASRKDFLVQAVRDMLSFADQNNIQGLKGTLLTKFRKTYGESND